MMNCITYIIISYMYLNFLKVYGLLEILNKSKDKNIQDTVELKEIVINVNPKNEITNNIVNTKKPFYKNSKFITSINYLYMLFIIMVVVWPCLYILLISILRENTIYITTNMFIFIHLVQYIFGLIFYQNDFFTQVIVYIKKYDKKITISYVFTTIISIILSTIFVILLCLNFNLNIYSELYNNMELSGRICFIIAILLNKIYSYNIYFSNIIMFSSNSIIQSIKINNYANKLNKLVSNNIKNINIEYIIKDYITLKEYHTQSINKLNNIFSSITLLGIIGLHFMILHFNTIYSNVFTYIDILCFAIIEGLYIYSMNKVKSASSEIKELINSPKFIDFFLSKDSFIGFDGDTYMNYKEELDIINKKNKKNKKYKRTNSDKLKNTDSLNKKMNFIKDKTLRLVIKAHESSDNIDWIILNSLLSEEWDKYSLLGFEIDDGTLIEKLIAIIIGFFMLSNISSKIN